MNNEEIRAYLLSLQDAKYQKFSAGLSPGETQIIGVRVPLVRELAKQIAQADYQTYLQQPYTDYHEERLLYGLVLGYIKAEFDFVLPHIDRWLPCVSSWGVCDSAVMNMKIFGKKQHQAESWKYWTSKLEQTQEPYIIRAAIVALFDFFNTEEYVEKVAAIFAGIKSEHYYINMALAWGVCEIMIKHYDVGLQLLESRKLSKWVHNKAIQKSIESFRLTDEQKSALRAEKI